MSGRPILCDILRAGDGITARARKRKFDAVIEVPTQEWFAYPSPPMSVPPSPAQSSAFDLPSVTSTASESAGSVIHEADTAAQVARGSSSTAIQPSPLPSIFGNPQASIDSVLSSQAHQDFGTAPRPIQAISTAPQLTTPPQQGPSTLSAAGAPSSRSSRRSKTHVASACINCKRAHLSCDVQRPCTRCVAAGKQDTCIDVQHKKRGRPRLREEADFKVEQMSTHGAAQASVPVGPATQPMRPIATTRQRRGDSFRSTQSFASDDSVSYAGSVAGHGHGALTSPFAATYPPTPNAARATFELATALLNMDLVVVRANRPFDNIMLRGQSTRGRHISEIAAPADNESFMAIRNRLRADREARDPAYMPPIQLPGQDPIQNIPESEVEHFVDDRSDRTYRWSQLQLGHANETFPARVRLAKASTYFVVVTLPSFQPVQQQHPVRAPLTFGPPLQPVERFISPREPALQSAPPQAFQYGRPVFAGIPSTPSGPFGMGPAPAYPPPPMQITPQQSQGYFAARPITPPRLPAAEPPTDTTAFTPRSVPREAMPPPAMGQIQLPPIMASPSVAATAAQRVAEGNTQHVSSSEDEAEGRPRRKRRMGIDHVLQR